MSFYHEHVPTIMGFYHEHVRADRDQSIDVLSKNVAKSKFI